MSLSVSSASSASSISHGFAAPQGSPLGQSEYKVDFWFFIDVYLRRDWRDSVTKNIEWTELAEWISEFKIHRDAAFFAKLFHDKTKAFLEKKPRMSQVASVFQGSQRAEGAMLCSVIYNSYGKSSSVMHPSTYAINWERCADCLNSHKPSWNKNNPSPENQADLSQKETPTTVADLFYKKCHELWSNLRPTPLFQTPKVSTPSLQGLDPGERWFFGQIFSRFRWITPTTGSVDWKIFAKTMRHFGIEKKPAFFAQLYTERTNEMWDVVRQAGFSYYGPLLLSSMDVLTGSAVREMAGSSAATVSPDSEDTQAVSTEGALQSSFRIDGSTGYGVQGMGEPSAAIGNEFPQVAPTQEALHPSFTMDALDGYAVQRMGGSSLEAISAPTHETSMQEVPHPPLILRFKRSISQISEDT